MTIHTNWSSAEMQRGTTAPSAAAPRLVRAAQEFEGQMMKELLQPLLAGDGSGEEDSSGANGTLGEFGAEALGQALSRRGGFGIATRILADLSHSRNPDHRGKVTGNPHHDTGISPHQ